MTNPNFFIPGQGWDTESIVSGYIKFESQSLISVARKSIDAYPFDDVYPFTNIFGCHTPAHYGAAVIGFAGSYKQVEEDWCQWLWKFADLLSRLEAIEAFVNLDCVIGNFRWKLEPLAILESATSGPLLWGITSSPEGDFSIHPEWLSHFSSDWRRFVPRTNNASPSS